MARKFLYVIAGIVVLIFVVLLLLRVFSEELTEAAFVPSAKFEAQAALPGNAYGDPAMWLARPGLGESDASRWLPAGVERAAKPLEVAVFFVHPTSYMNRAAWNAPLDDAEANDRARLFTKTMASPFNDAARLWAPRYRQATVGAFFTNDRQAVEALNVAYADIEKAFAAFVAQVPENSPIVLVGHSQGAFLLRRLIADRVRGTSLAPRVAAAYLAGWPVSVAHDLPAMGMKGCAAADESGCLVTWLSVADPADTTMLLKGYGRKRGLDGQSVGGSAFVCTNPLTGGTGQAAASANLGTLVPDFAKKVGTIAKGVVPASCEADNFLHIGPPPTLEMGPFVMPGNNYHVYDITLFWSNLREDFSRRVGAWHQKAAAQ